MEECSYRKVISYASDCVVPENVCPLFKVRNMTLLKNDPRLDA